MIRTDYFSVGKLEVGGLEIRVRYRTRCVDDVFSTEKAEQLLPPTSTTSNVSQQDLLQTNYEVTRIQADETSQLKGEPTSSETTVPGANASFDGTGLLVWPGSRLLASFLAHPLGVRHCYPQLTAGWTFEESMPLPSATEKSRLPSKPVLELGAGTGICGMVACRALGCPAILTDRRGDVIGNLHKNVALNGMEHSVRVVRLEWGGDDSDNNKGIPIEVEEHSPFQVILASDTVYPGKPSSDTQAFFDIVKELLDPTEGVLLLAYTPRPPSFETESMLRCAYRAGLSGKKLDGAWNRACTRDDGGDDSCNDGDDDDGVDGLVNNRSPRDRPIGGGNTAIDGSSSADRSCTSVNGCGGWANSNACANTRGEPKHLLDELSCCIDSSADSSCASVNGCSGGCLSAKREPMHLLEELSPCGENYGASSSCGGVDSCGNCIISSSADSSSANVRGGGNGNICRACIKREPTRLSRELTPCGENRDDDDDGDACSSSACCGADGCGRCRRRRCGCCGAHSCRHCRGTRRGDSIGTNTPHRAKRSGNAKASRCRRCASVPLAAPRPKRCTPVLLAFGLSPQVALGDKEPCSAADGQQSPCVSEQVWLSRWKDVFPDVNYRNRPNAFPLVERSWCLEQRQQQQQARVRAACSGVVEGVDVEDAVTWECLWGVVGE